jgi:hypothetical protein
MEDESHGHDKSSSLESKIEITGFRTDFVKQVRKKFRASIFFSTQKSIDQFSIEKKICRFFLIPCPF